MIKLNESNPLTTFHLPNTGTLVFTGVIFYIIIVFLIVLHFNLSLYVDTVGKPLGSTQKQKRGN